MASAAVKSGAAASDDDDCLDLFAPEPSVSVPTSTTPTRVSSTTTAGQPVSLVTGTGQSHAGKISDHTSDVAAADEKSISYSSPAEQRVLQMRWSIEQVLFKALRLRI